MKAHSIKEKDVNRMTTVRQARKLTSDIKTAIKNVEYLLKEFHKSESWTVLGYDSFLSWWDAELGPIPLATSLRNWAIVEMIAGLRTNGQRVPSGTYGEVAAATGTTTQNVRNLVTRARYQTRMTGMSDDEMIQFGVLIPNRWRRYLVKVAADRNLNIADVLRPIIRDGLKKKYGVDVDEPIISTRRK